MKERSGYQKWRLTVLALLGSKCAVCGNDDIRVLEINHVFNDGYLLTRKHRTGASSGGLTAKHLRLIALGEDDLARYEALCANCHTLRTKGFI